MKARIQLLVICIVGFYFVKGQTVSLDTLSLDTASANTLNAAEELTKIKSLLLDEVNLDALVEKAYKASGLLEIDRSKITQQENLLIQERKSWMRTFRFGVNFLNVSTVPSTVNPGTDVTQTSVLSNIGLSISINPEDIFSRRNRINVAEQELMIKKIDRKNDIRDLRIFITNKFLQYQEALEIFIIRENALMIADENLLYANEQFRQGRMKSIDHNQFIGDLMLKKEALITAETQVLKLKNEIETLTQLP